MVASIRRLFPWLSPVPQASVSPYGPTHWCEPHDTAFDRLTPASPDCILKSAYYLCLWDETVSPGFPTRTRLLIWSRSPRDDRSFQLSAAGLSSVRFRFPDQPLPQDQSRPRSEFDAAPRTLTKAGVRLRRTPSSIPVSKVWDSTAWTPTTSSGLPNYSPLPGLFRAYQALFRLAWRECVLTDTRSVSGLVSDEGAETLLPTQVCRLPLTLRLPERRS